MWKKNCGGRTGAAQWRVDLPEHRDHWQERPHHLQDPRHRRHRIRHLPRQDGRQRSVFFSNNILDSRDFSTVYVFWPPGSGSISTRYRSGIRILLSSCKISKKNIEVLFLTVLWLLYDFLSLKKDVNVASKSKNQKNLGLKSFLVSILKVTDKNSRISGSVSQRCGSGDPGSHLYQNVTDPQHCFST